MTRKIEQFSESAKAMKAILHEEAEKFLNTYYTKPESPNSYSAISSDSWNISFVPKLKTTSTKQVLGECVKDESGYYHILLSEVLLRESVTFDTLRQVLGHELAHMLDMHHNFGGTGHGESFKEVCRLMEVSFNQALVKEVEETNNILNKIKKLLALAESDNLNEAQSALVKAKQLMAENGITERANDSSEKVYRVELTKYKNFTKELSVLTSLIKRISNTWILLSTGDSSNTLFAHGAKTECEVAAYLFDYLQRELRYFFYKEKAEKNFRAGAKNSFYHGVLIEMEKRFSLQENHNDWGLVEYSKETEKLAKKLIYSKKKVVTRASAVGFGRSQSAYNSGKEVGRSLRIYNGVTASSALESGKYLN